MRNSQDSLNILILQNQKYPPKSTSKMANIHVPIFCLTSRVEQVCWVAYGMWSSSKREETEFLSGYVMDAQTWREVFFLKTWLLFKVIYMW